MDKLVSLSIFFCFGSKRIAKISTSRSRRRLVNMVKAVNVVLEPAESETEYHKLAASCPTH